MPVAGVVTEVPNANNPPGSDVAPATVLAPMAGVTDPPFRELCAEFGAALACGEMLSADQSLWHTPKSRRRMAAPSGALGAVAVQLAGADPQQLAAAAQQKASQSRQQENCPARFGRGLNTLKTWLN